MKTQLKNTLKQLSMLLTISVFACVLCSFTTIDGLPDNALYFIDDDEATKAEVERLSSESIHSINVLKEGLSLPLADKAKQGVVLVYTNNYRKLVDEAVESGKSNLPDDKRIVFTRSTTRDKATNQIKKSQSSAPLIFIDGKEVSAEYYLNEFDHATETSNTALVPKVAQRIYGDKGKHGIIFVSTEKQFKSTSTSVVTERRVEKGGVKKVMDSTTPQSVLFIVDGKKMSQGRIQDINPEDIEAIDILKGETAIERYGEEGQNGVIIIRTKK